MKKRILCLTDAEPIIDVILKPTAAFVAALKAANEKIPAPVGVRALIDTGFTGGLMIAESLVKGWGLRTRNFSRITFPRDQEGRFFDTFAWEVDVAIKFMNCSRAGGNVLVETPATLVEFVNSKNSQVLLGQEIIQVTTFFYNGPKEYFELEFP